MLLPAIFRGLINNVQQNAQQNARQQYYQQQPPKQPEGRVKVDYIPEGNKQKLPDTEGEFVDYEEIK